MLRARFSHQIYHVFPEIPYEITVWTGDQGSAGTDANVFIQMYGENGKTEEYHLRNKTDNFEKDHIDKFKVRSFKVICSLMFPAQLQVIILLIGQMNINLIYYPF